jgi:hypothetical protein
MPQIQEELIVSESAANRNNFSSQQSRYLKDPETLIVGSKKSS